jgi:hypothetical protein
VHHPDGGEANDAPTDPNQVELRTPPDSEGQFPGQDRRRARAGDAYLHNLGPGRDPADEVNGNVAFQALINAHYARRWAWDSASSGFNGSSTTIKSAPHRVIRIYGRVGSRPSSCLGPTAGRHRAPSWRHSLTSGRAAGSTRGRLCADRRGLCLDLTNG